METAATSLGGRYQLLGELGRGAVGIVHRAREVASGRDLALKVLAGRATPTQVERFKREAELTASLMHPGIVRVHDAGALDGVAFIAYELVEGCSTLEDLLERRALDLPARVRLIVEVAKAVGFAHVHGILHRDLKPANVLIDAAGRARVADFGLATATGLERLTMTGMIVGTPAYMAPEQITGGVPSPATDVWALGVMLYLALTGVTPFDAGSLAELSVRICNQRPPSPRAHAPEISEALAGVCLRALVAAPDGRYPDALAFALDLERASAARPRRRRRLALALTISVVVAASFALTWALGREPAPTLTPAPVAPPKRSAAPSPEGRFSTWVSTRLQPTHRRAVKARARLEPLPEVERALADLERDPATAPLAALRCAAWLREARDDLAPVDEERGRRVFERWMAKARLAHPDAAREFKIVNDAYWSSDPGAISVGALDRLAEALGAALLLGRWNPYDFDGDVADPLLDLAALSTSDAPLEQRRRLKDDLTERAPSEPLLVTVWMQLSRGGGAMDVAALQHAAWEAHRRLVAVMPTDPPTTRWRRVHGEMVARLRWRTNADAPTFVLQEAGRAQAGPIALFLAAETACAFAEDRPPEQALEQLRRAWTFVERVPADERDAAQLRMRARIQELALVRAPRWFVDLPLTERPPALLPEGLRWGERPGEYIQASDGAVLEWASGSFRVRR